MKPSIRSTLIVSKSLALASWCRLSAFYRHLSHNKVIPHCYGTWQKDASGRTAEGSVSETHAGSGADAAATQSSSVGQTRVDSEQLGHTAGVARLRRAAAVPMGDLRPTSAHRAGDCAGQGVGEQEAGVVRRRLVGTSLLVTLYISGYRYFLLLPAHNHPDWSIRPKERSTRQRRTVTSNRSSVSALENDSHQSTESSEFSSHLMVLF